MAKILDLFEFSEYREYLSAWLDSARSEGRSSLSKVAQAIGVHTSFLSHVLAGSKNLSFEQATEICEVLNHTPIEREYFFALLQIERAGTQKLKKYWLDKKSEIEAERTKVKSRVGKHTELSPEDKAIFYSSWIYLAIFVATAIDDGQTLDQIAKLFEITRSKAEEVLNFLVTTGICELQGSKYKMGKSVVFISNESPLVVKHHTNWRMKAIQKMDTRDKAELFYSSPMSVSRTDFLKIRELLVKAVEDSLTICRDSPAEEVICLNIDYFKVE